MQSTQLQKPLMRHVRGSTLMSSPSTAALTRRLKDQIQGGGPDVRLATEMLRLMGHDPDVKRGLSNWLLCKLGIQAKYNVLSKVAQQYALLLYCRARGDCCCRARGDCCLPFASCVIGCILFTSCVIGRGQETRRCCQIRWSLCSGIASLAKTVRRCWA